MAAEQKERTAKLAERRQELGEQELRHTVQPGIRKMLNEMMAWYGVEEVSEAVQLLVMNAKPQEIPPAPPRQPGKSETIRHYFRQGMRDRLAELASGLGETKDAKAIERVIAHAYSLSVDQCAAYFSIPRHALDVSENVARKLRQAGFAEALQMNAEDDCDND
ncbi:MULTISPECIES: hypothetical protein [unclassified Pseudomonas]|jgi:hypothetical protein|uniref:hypothetical protein n=1 Tax=Pseudomonas TaxID=286 RepID=UPI000C885411|nr:MULTISPECIES: hypothetical protein [unclassified Pseudomonas]MBL1311231.1 hypothetical protein [Pseudomonas sp.]PMX19138.1 hypothetical protein C1Y25_00610 [Pseudomonas sp. MPBC4-3]PMX50099.1 hypothetical protein C1Y20_04325 [Pseudomonas sp. FW301-21B01]PMY10815.1 hypothetical protein C1Y18_02155 [Pseudomonas sp. MPR-R5A]PNA72982.1 hypothetical protein C1Y14_01710 [Pseudomonas sp. MPR-R5B]